MDENYFGSPLRRQIVFFVIIGFFSLQVFQLVRMQLLNRDMYEEKSNENSIKTKVINSARGILYDRNVNLLLGNKASFYFKLLRIIITMRIHIKSKLSLESIQGI